MTINTLDTKGYWTVNGTPIYVPQGCKVEHSNVVSSDSGRDESGYMHITWLRRDVRKVYLTWNYLTGSELAYMMNLMQGKEFTFKFLNNSSTASISGYVGESSYEHYNYSSFYNDKVYKNFSINVIEK